MAEVAIDLVSSHRQEDDGSHTVTVTISGIPSMDAANNVSRWMRDLVRANASKLGRLDVCPN
jgi:hypothetical protein